MILDDAVIVERVLAGDDALYGDLISRYEGRLAVYVTQIVGVPEEARDLVQEAFIRVWRNLTQYNNRYRFSTWLFRIAHNLAIDHLRRRRQQVISLEQGHDSDGDEMRIDPADIRRGPLANLANRELAHALEREIFNLQPSYRELVVLRHLVGLSYNEIAELKGLPLGTVKNKLFRAHSVLREALGEFLGQLGGRV